MRMIDLTGKEFDRLTVIERATDQPYKRVHWVCECECGNTTIVSGEGLRYKTTKSCGCFRNEGSYNITHGMTGTRFFRIWHKIHERCENPKTDNYKWYGGKGIKVCPRWDSFDNFIQDMHESYLLHVKEYGEKDTTIDRIEFNGMYEPSNCRWATKEEQMNNQSVTLRFAIDGKVFTIKELSIKYNKPVSLIRDRVYRGWSIERALSQPKRERKLIVNE